MIIDADKAARESFALNNKMLLKDLDGTYILVTFTTEIVRRQRQDVGFAHHLQEWRLASHHAAQAPSGQHREAVCHEAGNGRFARSGSY